MEIKVNIGDPKAKKTAKLVLANEQVKPLLHKKVGDFIKGDEIGYDGYEFEITGGSDYCGFPMRKDVDGTMRKKILIVSGTGLRKNRPGRKVRKNVAGNTVYENTAQVNLKVIKHGKKPLFEEPKAEAAEGEAKAEEKKE
ncbi:30S ribosomal protein S6e [Candidatus Woesearchaeota archaeon]|nr:30S ribosomal protein S6e [Candidatus Woesearchaeota archaeon]